MNSSTRTGAFRAEDLSVDVVDAALRRMRAVKDARVSSLSFEPISEGHGFVGKSVRCLISYDGVAHEAPRSIVVKTATDDDGLRRGFHEFRLYEREVRFYRELRDDAGVPTPRCYHAELDSQTGEFMLLLEDLAPAVPGDPITGCSVEQAREALELIADMHLRWWKSERLEALEWLPGADALRINRGIESTFDEAWSAFRARVGKGFPRSILRFGDRLGGQLPEVLSRLSSPPRTLVHGDYQLGNVFYSADGKIASVIDWQVIIKARGAMDVAHFVARSLQPEDRRSAERELVRHYHSKLQEGGVTEYDFPECWDDYRLAVLSQFGLGILLAHGLTTTSSVQPKDGVRDALASVVGGRLIAALVDLRPEVLLESKPIWRRVPFLSRRDV